MVLSDSSYYLKKLYGRLPADVKGHSMRVSVLMHMITDGYYGSGIRIDSKYYGESRETVTQFAREAGFYHDIGKIMIPTEILNKPGDLTPEEHEEMRKHAQYAAELLNPCINRLIKDEQQYYYEIRDVCVAHHERWDGEGYPYGFSKEEIPFFSRICAVADTYDALTSKRRYSNAMSHNDAVDEIVRNSGTQFDPDVIQAFLTQSFRIQQLLINKSARGAKSIRRSAGNRL